jgi:type VI secretion system protein VasJ
MPPTLEELRERARPWAEPVPGAAPAGVQAKHEPAYEAITSEVAKLESPAASGVRWDTVVQGASELLKGTTKDLWLAAYMAYGLYATRGLDGAATGAAVLIEVTERYWPDLYPELKRLRGRANAVGWFVERLGRMLPAVDQATVSADSLEALSVTMKRLAQLSRERFADSAPAFGPIQDAIARLRAGLPPPPEPAEAVPAGGDFAPATASDEASMQDASGHGAGGGASANATGGGASANGAGYGVSQNAAGGASANAAGHGASANGAGGASANAAGHGVPANGAGGASANGAGGASTNAAGHGASANGTGTGASAHAAGHGASANTSGHAASASASGGNASANTAGHGASANTAGHGASANAASGNAAANTAGHGASANTAGHGASANTAGHGASATGGANAASGNGAAGATATGAGKGAPGNAASAHAAAGGASPKGAAGTPANTARAAPAPNTVKTAPAAPVVVPPLPTLPAAPDLSSAEAVTDFLRTVGTALLASAGALRRASVEDPLAYRLMRTGLWLHLSRPPAAGPNGRTPLQPMPDALRNKLQTLESNQRWPDLLDEAESALGQHRFALVLHRFSATALEALGEPYAAARAALVQELGAQLRRMPGVEELVAANGTPLTDDATRAWLRAEVLPTGSSAPAEPTATSAALALPPLALSEASSSGSSPALEEEARALLDAGRVHEAVTLLQGAVASATTGRARFLSRLALARLCANAGQLPLARAVYDALDEEVSAHSLDTWEPALAAACLEGWLSTRTPGEKEEGRVAAKVRNRYRRLARLDSSAALRVGA